MSTNIFLVHKYIFMSTNIFLCPQIYFLVHKYIFMSTNIFLCLQIFFLAHKYFFSPQIYVLAYNISIYNTYISTYNIATLDMPYLAGSLLYISVISKLFCSRKETISNKLFALFNVTCLFSCYHVSLPLLHPEIVAIILFSRITLKYLFST